MKNIQICFKIWGRRGFQPKKSMKLLSTLSSLTQQIKIVLTQHICQKSYFHATSDIK